MNATTISFVCGLLITLMVDVRHTGYQEVQLLVLHSAELSILVYMGWVSGN